MRPINEIENMLGLFFKTISTHINRPKVGVPYKAWVLKPTTSEKVKKFSEELSTLVIHHPKLFSPVNVMNTMYTRNAIQKYD